MNTNFYSLWFDQTGNRTRVYRFSSRRSIHSTTDRYNMKYLKGKMPILTAKSSSVAGGGGGRVVWSFYWHAEYAKHPAFITFETNVCSKSKNSPPIVTGNKNVTALALYLKRIRSQNSIPTWSKTFFFRFWSSPNFGQKNVPIPSVNCFRLISYVRDSLPPIANSWLRAWLKVAHVNAAWEWSLRHLKLKELSRFFTSFKRKAHCTI